MFRHLKTTDVRPPNDAGNKLLTMVADFERAVVHSLQRNFPNLQAADFADCWELTLVESWLRCGFLDHMKPVEVLSWLKVVAKNAALKKLRECRKRQRVEDGFRDRLLSWKAPRHGDLPMWLEGAINDLSEPERALLRQRYWSGMHQDEIARTNQTARGTVGSQLARVLKKLRARAPQK